MSCIDALAKREGLELICFSAEPAYYRSRSHLLLRNIRWFLSSMIGALEFTARILCSAKILPPQSWEIATTVNTQTEKESE